MTDSKTPEWVATEADKVGQDIYGRHERGFVMWPLITKCGTPPRDLISQALLSAYERGRAERTWQPIETAPKDGTFVITILGNCVPCVCRWQEHFGKARFGAEPDDFMAEEHFEEYWRQASYSPSHWMPLPAPPAKENANER